MNLKIFGLNKYESEVFLTLIKKGESTVGEIHKESNVPHNRIYDVVESLINKKLAYEIPGFPKKYVGANPKEIREQIINQKKELEKLDSKFEELEKIYQGTQEQKIIVSRTGKNFVKIVKELPLAEKFEYTLRSQLDTRAQYVENHKNAKKRNLEVKLFYDNRKEGTKEFKFWKKIEPNMKPIKSKDIILSINEKGVLISLSEPANQSAIIYIENSNLSEVMKQLFDAYYKKTTDKPSKAF